MLVRVGDTSYAFDVFDLDDSSPLDEPAAAQDLAARRRWAVRAGVLYFGLKVWAHSQVAAQFGKTTRCSLLPSC